MRRLLISLAIIVGVLLVGYISFARKGFFLIPGLGAVGLNSTCKFQDPDLCRFMNRALAADYFNGNFSGTSSTTLPSGSILSSSWETDGDTKSHMTNSIDGAESFNMIIIENTTYVKDYSDGKWWKQLQSQAAPVGQKAPDDVSVQTVKDTLKQDVQKAFATTAYKKIGSKPCRGSQCLEYQVLNPADPDTVEYILFDTDQYVLQSTHFEEKDGTVVDSNYSYHDINIQEPSPVKIAAAGQNIFTNARQVEKKQKASDLEYIKQFQQQMQKDVNH